MYRCCASLLSPSQADPKRKKQETTHTNNGSYMRRFSAGWFRYVSLLVGKGLVIATGAWRHLYQLFESCSSED